MEGTNKYKVLNDYAVYLGEGRDKKIYGKGSKDGITFEATEAELKGQMHKVELISGKPAKQTQEQSGNGSDEEPKGKNIGTSPKNRMQRQASTK